MAQTTTITNIRIEPGATANTRVTTTGVVKASAGTACNLKVVAPGSAGMLTVNNAATVDGATQGNEVLNISAAALIPGQLVPINTSCNAGVVVSSVPSGGVYILAYA